jgi:uncharacterized protein (DUF58 family)
MLRPNTIYGLSTILLCALLFGLYPLALICAVLLLSAGIAWLWNRWALARVTYERELDRRRAFPGDEIALVLRVANRKPLPLVALEVRETVPPGLEVIGERLQPDMNGRLTLRRTTSMRWYEAVVWRYRVRPLKRGAYRLGPVQLEAGDPFGFYSTTLRVPAQSSLLVYPRPLPLEALGLRPRHPLGDLRARQLIRDPLRTVGVRDYHPDDPLKDVHWTATARVGTLQTRVYETTTALDVAIFLDLDSFEHYWHGIDEDLVERLISAAAAVAQAGAEEGYAVGLYANGAPAEYEQIARLPPARSAAQLDRIMETLARLTPYSVTSIARVLQASAGDVPWGATILLISAVPAEATRAALLRLREAGRTIVWLFLGEGPPPEVPGVLVRHAPASAGFRGRAGRVSG